MKEMAWLETPDPNPLHHNLIHKSLCLHVMTGLEVQKCKAFNCHDELGPIPILTPYSFRQSVTVWRHTHSFRGSSY